MLTRVLQAIEDADGAIELRALSRELGIDPSALDGMIQHWVAKGRLVDASCGAEATSGCVSCGPSCGPDGTCPFVVSTPRVVAVAAQPDDD